MKIFQEYTKELAEALAKNVAKINVKEVKGSGEFKVIATTATADRDGESILVEGWDFENFMKNPIILFGHNYWDMDCIIGAATKVYVEDGQVIVEGVFADTESGQFIRKLYDDGILRTVSVGFIPKMRNGSVITQAELLELSFVPVPANPEALSLAKSIYAAQEFEKKFVKKTHDDEKGENDKEENEEKKEEVEKNKEEKALALSPDRLNQFKSDLSALADAYILEAQATSEVKAGRVLSAKNETIIKTAITACDAVIKPLQALLAAVNEEARDDEGKMMSNEAIKQLQDFMKGADKLIEKALVNLKTNAK